MRDFDFGGVVAEANRIWIRWVFGFWRLRRIARGSCCDAKQRCWRRIEFAMEPLGRPLAIWSWRRIFCRAKPEAARGRGSISSDYMQECRDESIEELRTIVGERGGRVVHAQEKGV